MLPKISEGADREEKREWLGDFVRIIILIWSAGLLTASYVRLPSGQKIMDFDPTFIASVFSGSLAGFGVAVAKNGVQNTNGNGSQPSLSEAPVYSRPKEEEKTEPEVQPVWSEPEPTPEPNLESRVEALEAKVETGEEPPSEEGFVQPRRGDL